MRLLKALGLMALGSLLTMVVLIATRADPVGPFVFPAYMGGGDLGFVAPYWPPVSELDRFAIDYSAAMRCEMINMSLLSVEVTPPRGLLPGWIEITCSA
ncbi:hypothetical protein K3728_07450 [Rhodobacteraceae bacterium M385]|nr:hypothetical protein K3728_07450 [Rhodobacteraceae bacterium M385]